MVTERVVVDDLDAKLKDGRRVFIRVENLPDIYVFDWIGLLDLEGRLRYRHHPNSREEIQWFAYDRRSEIIAYASLAGLSEEVVFGCAILQGWRGVGLGNILYPMAIDLARAHGKKVITAEQDAGNEPAHALCRKLGFTFEGPFTEDVNGMPYGPFYRLRKEL